MPFEATMLVGSYDTGTGYIGIEYVRGIEGGTAPEWFRDNAETEERLARMRPEEFLALIKADVVGMPIPSAEEGSAWAANPAIAAFLRPHTWLGFRSGPAAEPNVFVEVGAYDRDRGEITFRDVITDTELPSWFRIGVPAEDRRTRMRPEELMWHLEIGRARLITPGPAPDH